MNADMPPSTLADELASLGEALHVKRSAIASTAGSHLDHEERDACDVVRLLRLVAAIRRSTSAT